jgi:hypothetical protein
MRLLLFCEADADFRTVSGLVDRVLRDQGPGWVHDLIDAHPEGVRQWTGDDQGRVFFNIHQLTEYAKRLKLRPLQGRFDGKPGAPGALMARTAFRIARAVIKGASPFKEPRHVDAVFMVWDMDHQGEQRRIGLEQARQEASPLGGFRVIIGCPDPMREAWVLAGFGPESDDERARLTALCHALGFGPCEEAHRLRDKGEHDRRSPKRALRALTDGDPEREERCWKEPPLSLLRARGRSTGLGTFLDDVARAMVPLLSP